MNMDEQKIEEVARVICREETQTSIVEIAGSLDGAFATSDHEQILDHIVDRAWPEYVDTAHKVFEAISRSI
ncbi:MAG: hypothetical protein HQL69_07990 [Magnetococcales bacterium]|nr:hypothetical protein [Magnetococcales bacterium]